MARSPQPLSRDRLRELTIDTIASWALEGMHPDAQTLADMQAVLDGQMSMEEFNRRTYELAGR